MGTLGRATRNGKKPPPRRVEPAERPHPAIAKLAVALRENKEAAEQQAATAEILRAISKSPGDAQPVFDAIVEKAHRLCGGAYTVLYRYDGKLLHFVAAQGVDERAVGFLRGRYPQGADRDKMVGRAVLEAKTFHTADISKDSRFPAASAIVRRRAVVAVPLVRHDKVMGAISCGRIEARDFTRKDISLLRTFADQAVIAMENARLFNETKDALERQTATAEILRVISQSQTDTQPVFDAIVRSAVRLCAASFGSMLRIDGDTIRLEAYYNPSSEGGKLMASRFPAPLSEHSLVALAARTGEVVHSPDTASDPRSAKHPIPRALGVRAQLTVPLLRQGKAVALLNVVRDKPGPFSEAQIEVLKTFADQAVVAIENVRLFTELQTSNRDLTTALDTQTATSDILRVISRSQTDVQPVFDAIVHSAVRLLRGYSGALSRVNGDEIVLMANTSTDETGDAATKAVFPQLLRSEFPHAQAIRAGTPFNVADAETDDRLLEDARAYAHVRGYRSWIVVPMLRQNEAIGAIGVTRREAGGFTDDEIALLQTFADQAVIAIENVRLFNETKEALEQQRATGEILASMSESIIDAKPVFDAIVRNLLRLFGTRYASVALVRDGKLEIAGIKGDRGYESLVKRFPVPINDQTLVGKVALAGKVMQFAPMVGNPAVPPGSERFAREFGFNAQIMAPMIRDGEVIGVISTAHRDAVLFDEQQVALLKSFAAQAVIAIENVRLFNETKEALDQQKASADVLGVISSSIADTKPVFDKILESCQRLFEGHLVGINLVGEDGLLHIGAYQGPGREELEKLFPLQLDCESGSGRAILSRQVVHYPDCEAPEVPEYARQGGKATGVRSELFAPMIWEERGIGVLWVGRTFTGAFSEKQIALLKTFADQAVIAIQNARLFNETKEALEQQTATAEILRVISSSPSDVQPVFETIVRNSVKLCEAEWAAIWRYDGKLQHFVATSENFPPAVIDKLRAIYPCPPRDDATSGRAILLREVVAIPDVMADTALNRELGSLGGWRRQMGVPMLLHGQPLGVITIGWKEAGPPRPRDEALLRTFADQAVIAIENVRLFKELQERTEALTKSVKQLTALGEVGQAISSTLDLETVLKTIVSRAVQLTGLDAGAVYEYDERADEFQLRAAENMSDEVIDALRRRPIKKGDGAVGRTAVAREPIQVPETQDEGYKSGFRDLIIRTGRRALLAVPLMREDRIVGALAVHRNTPGPFAPEVVDLLKTFATQSALAIQNANLFREIAEKGKQLEIASRHKSDFLASMSHELRTPLNAILGFNEMVIDEIYGPVPEGMKSPLENIQSSGKHLLRLINNVLDLAKIEAGRMELALSDYSVQDTVSSVYSTLRPLAAEKGLDFVAEVSPDIPTAHGDAGRLAQCLMNLAGNSLKFTRHGRVAIAVAQRDGLLRFSVADTGIGIPPEKIASLFTEFKQTDATIASEYGGTGLGLSITKKFIEMHGGRIWVESELGKGSNFLFEIPLRVGR
jgi:GAF domain-containing protein